MIDFKMHNLLINMHLKKKKKLAKTYKFETACIVGCIAIERV